jgi:hypothetical protein
MPGLMAQQIIGVQPMTGPAGSIFSMRARYADWKNFSLGCKPECDWQKLETYTLHVELPLDLDNPPDIAEIVTWAVLNLTKSFNYSKSDTGWRWVFADEDDAFHFKMRWR